MQVGSKRAVDPEEICILTEAAVPFRSAREGVKIGIRVNLGQ